MKISHEKEVKRSTFLQNSFEEVLDPNFYGSRIDQYVLPNLKIEENYFTNSVKINREPSTTNIEITIPYESNLDISSLLKSILNPSQQTNPKLKLRLSIINDDKRLTQYIAWLIDQESFSRSHIIKSIRINFHDVINHLKSGNINQESFESLNKFVEKFSIKSKSHSKNPVVINDNHIFILENFDKMITFMGSNEYDSVNGLINDIAEKNTLIVSTSDCYYETTQRTFNFNFKVRNLGYNSQNIKKYIRNVIEDSNLQYKIINFLKENPSIYKLSQQPMFLQTIIYLLEKSQDNFSVINLYKQLFRYHLNLPNKVFFLNDLFKTLPTHFVQRLAFESLELNLEDSLGSPIKRPFSISSTFALEEHLKAIRFGTAIYSETFEKVAEEMKKPDISKETISQFLFYTGLIVMSDSNGGRNSIIGRFKDQGIQLFNAAKYIAYSYANNDQTTQDQVRNFVTKNSFNPRCKLLMKFVIGIIDLNYQDEIREKAINMFLSDFELSNDEVIKIYNNKLVKPYMHLLSDISTNQIAKITEIRDKIDSIIVPNLMQWREVIGETKYSSPKITAKLFELLSGTRSEILEALYLLKKIKVSDQASLLNYMQFTVSSNDDYIVERSFEVLQTLEWSPKIEKLLQNLAKLGRENIAVMAVEVLAKHANLESLNILTDTLNESNSPQVIFATILALEHFACIKKYKGNIVNSLLQRLFLEKDLTFLNSHQIIRSLKALGLDEDQIVRRISTEFKKSNLENISTRMVNILSLLVKSLSQENVKIIVNLVYKEIIDKGWVSKIFHHHPFNKIYVYKEKTIELLSRNFHLFGETEKSNIYKFIVERTSHTNEIISKAAINALRYVFHFKPEETFNLLEKYTHGKKYDSSIKQLALSSLTKALVFSSVTDNILLDRLLENILQNIEKPIEAPVNKERFQSLKNIFPIVSEEQKTKIIDTLISNYSSIDKKLDNTDFLLNIYSDLEVSDKEKIFQHLLLVIDFGNNEEEKILIIRSLAKLYHHMSSTQIDLLANTLNHKPLTIPNNHIDNMLDYDVILDMSQKPAIIERVFQLMDRGFHDELPIKESIIKEIQYLYGAIIMIASRTLSENKLKLLSGLINKVGFDQKIIDLITQKSGDIHLERAIKILFPKNDLANKNPLLNPPKNIISNDQIAEILRNELDENSVIVISYDKIIISDKEFILDGDLAENIDTIKLFLRHLQVFGVNYNLPNKLSNAILDRHLGHLGRDAIRLSSIDISSDDNDPSETIALLEERTPFGNILYTKFSFFDEDSNLIEFDTTNDKSTLKYIFGNSGEGISFRFKTFYISEEQRKEFLHNIDSNGQKTFDLFSEGGRTINIKYNTLLEEHPLEERFEFLENKVDNIEHELMELRKKLITLDLDQETIRTTLDFIKSNNAIEPRTFKNLYQEHLYFSVRSSLNEIFLAAKVVNAKTNMVKNNRKGITGYLGSFFDYISPHVPIVGIAGKVLGTLLGALDTIIQARLVRKIASLAIDSNEMSHFADEFAQFIVDNRIDINKLSPNSFLEIFKIIESSEEGIEEAVYKAIEVMSEKASEYSPDPLKKKGSKDGEKIINFIITLLATDAIDTSNDFRENLSRLENVFKEHCLLPAPLKIKAIQRMRSTSDDSETIQRVRSSSFDSLPHSPSTLKRTLSLDSPHTSSLSLDQISRTTSRDSRTLEDSLSGDIENDGDNFIPTNNQDFNQREVISWIKGVDLAENNNGLIGGMIMNGAAVMPQLEYLLSRLPFKDLIPNFGIIDYIAPYKHNIYSALHVAGNIAYSYHYDINPIYSIASSAIFFSKPVMYGERNQLLQSLEPHIPHESMKFFAYVTSDSLISLGMALPFINLTPYAIGISLFQGASMGMVNYYYSNSAEGNIVGDMVGLGSTTYAASQCYHFAQQLDNILSKIIVAEACIPFLASTHYLSKFAGDIVGDAALYIKEYLIEDFKNASF